MRIRFPNEPASEDQKDFATKLGVEFPPDITKGAISKLIDAALEKREPTQGQLDYAARLDVAIPEDATFDDVSDLLDEASRAQFKAIMAANEDLRAGTRIMYEGCPYEITFVGYVKGRGKVELRAISPKSSRKDHKDRTVRIVDVADVTPATREEIQAYRLS